MNHKLYKVSGVFADTKRKRTRTIAAKNENHAKEIMINDGYLEPFEIIEVDFEKPTERQIEYAKDLGIEIPDNATKQDLSALISRHLENDSDPNPELYEFADKRGFLFSKYIGKKALYNLLFNNLEDVDKIAFFAFCVYRYLSEDRHANLDTSPHRDIFYDFANKMVNDESFVRSLNNYSGEDLRYFGKLRIDNNVQIYGGSVNTKAFKTTVSYLKEKGLLPRGVSTTKRINGNRSSLDNKPNEKKHSFLNMLFRLFSK
jgi:hypothetical protein